jgi:hypothetical protein
VTRNLIVLLVGLALIGLLVLVAFLSVPRVRSETPHAYRSLPEALFSRWPVLGSAGPYVSRPSNPLIGKQRPAVLASSTPQSSPQRRETPRSAISAPKPSASPFARPTTRPTGGIGTVDQGFNGEAGIASWYCRLGVSSCTAGFPASGLYAAAGPRLRVGNWRGRFVTVTVAGRSVVVRLVDWCACPTRLIDLYSSVVAALGLDPGRGIYPVSVEWQQ